MIYVKDMCKEDQEMLQNAPVKKFMPWDTSFKMESLSTPARPYFDAGATTSTGHSLNSILAIEQCHEN